MEVIAAAIELKSNWINYLRYLILNTLLNILWVAHHSWTCLVKSRQKKYQKVFDGLGVVCSLQAQCAPRTQPSAVCWHLASVTLVTQDTIFSVICKRWAERPKVKFLSIYLKVTVTDGMVNLSEETVLPCPRWEQRLSSCGWNHWGLWIGPG